MVALTQRFAALHLLGHAADRPKIGRSYTVAFFKSVFTGKVQKLLKAESEKWPEVIFDTFDLNAKGENSTKGAAPYVSGGSGLVESNRVRGIGQAICMICLMLFMLGDM